MAVPLAGLPARGKGGAACYPFQGYEFDTAVPAVHGSRWPRLSAVRAAGGDYVALFARKRERAPAKRARRAKAPEVTIFWAPLICPPPLYYVAVFVEGNSRNIT